MNGLKLPEPMPKRIACLPRDVRGYPVPWFVLWQDAAGELAKRGEGTADFRILFPNVRVDAIRRNACWICGQRP